MSRVSTLDALLFLMAVIWGTNYVVIKSAVSEMDPLAFNAVRMSEASLVMLLTMAIMRRRAQVVGGSSDRGQGVSDVFHTPAKVTRADWLRLAASRPGRPLSVSVPASSAGSPAPLWPTAR